MSTIDQSTLARWLLFTITIANVVLPVNSWLVRKDFDQLLDDKWVGKQNETYSYDSETEETFILDAGSNQQGNIKGLYQPDLYNLTCGQVLTSAHCAYLGLTEVPSHLSPDITFLNLSNNKIGAILNGTFRRYASLNILTLEANNLSRLDPDSFIGLNKLVYLNLRDNHLEMPHAFPKGVFSPLTSLMYLNIQKNNKMRKANDYDYPEMELVRLSSLRVLCMDGLNNRTFGKAFRRMTSLRSLVLSGFDGFCILTNASGLSFENLDQITTLVISNCSILPHSLPDDVFTPLKRLSVLDIQDNHKMGFRSFLRAMAPLKYSNLQFLYANAIISRYSLAITVNSTLVDALPRSLVYLEARENCFESVDPDVFPMVPLGLKFLDVGNNRLIFGDYLQNLTWMENLQTLKVNGETFLTNIPRRFEHMDGFASFRSPDSFDAMKANEISPLLIHLPPRLVEIDMSLSGLKYIFSEISFDKNNSLEYLRLSMNYLPVLRGPVTGVHKLKHLDMSYCSVREMSLTFFSDLTSLEKLILSYNNLNVSFASQSDDFSPFQNLRSLMYLDLSHNQLTWLPSSLFMGLDQLQILDMHSNRMWRFDVAISHMSNLMQLLLTDTELNSLEKPIRAHIDRLNRDTDHGVDIDLSHSPLHCDCDNFDFLQWMVNSQAFDKTFPFYMCSYPDTSYKVIQDQYARDLKRLKHVCTSHYMLFLIVLLCNLCLFSVIILGIIYRFRWKLRYLYYMAYRIVMDRKNLTNQGDFKYDVFICYANKDERFVISELMTELSKRGLKLHIHGRDFAVGNTIASNIDTAIHESRKTLVILTRRWLASKWCKCELQIANFEAVYTGRRVLAFLLKESIPSSDLGTELLYHIWNNTYLLYPQSDEVKDEEITKAFWDKLAKDLRMS